MKPANRVSHESDHDWEYIPGQESLTSALRWKIFSGGSDSPSDGITFGVFEVPTGHTLDPHHHKPAEAYYVLEGEGELLMDGQIRNIGQGSVVYIKGDEIHGIRNNSGSLLKLIWVFPSDSYDEIEYHMDTNVTL